jgi:hypothetical protein
MVGWLLIHILQNICITVRKIVCSQELHMQCMQQSGIGLEPLPTAILQP